MSKKIIKYAYKAACWYYIPIVRLVINSYEIICTLYYFRHIKQLLCSSLEMCDLHTVCSNAVIFPRGV